MKFGQKGAALTQVAEQFPAPTDWQIEENNTLIV